MGRCAWGMASLVRSHARTPNATRPHALRVNAIAESAGGLADFFLEAAADSLKRRRKAAEGGAVGDIGEGGVGGAQQASGLAHGEDRRQALHQGMRVRVPRSNVEPRTDATTTPTTLAEFAEQALVPAIEGVRAQAKAKA